MPQSPKPLPTPPDPPAPGTRDRILETALRLFADRGFSETSLRMITTEAGVNLAAVNYHFGSKDALIGEVFGRLVGPVNEERIRRLEQVERESGSGPLDLEEVVDAFVTPVLDAWNQFGETAIRLMGRTYAESSDHFLRIFKEHFEIVVERFARAMHRALPELERDEVLWRLLFAVGVLVHTMLAHDRLKAVFPDMKEPATADSLRPRLIAFICGGLRAPLPSVEGRAEEGGKR